MGSLYHYTKMTTAIEYILPEMYLRTNSLAMTNDPRESQLWSFGSINVPFSELYPNYYNERTHIDCQYKLGREIKDEIQVISFSGAKQLGWDNEMMWAHYSQNHIGICLEFDEAALISNFEQSFVGMPYYIGDVYYGAIEHEPWINWETGASRQENIHNYIESHYQELVLTKSPFWEKEDERRLLTMSYAPLLLSIKNALKGIYLGLSFSHHYLPAIEQFISDSDVKLYDLLYSDYKYERWERKLGDKRLPITRKPR